MHSSSPPFVPCQVGPLSPRNGASSGCGWRKRPPDMVGSYEYIKQAVADSRQGVVLQLRGLDVGLTTPHRQNNLVTKIYKCFRPLSTNNSFQVSIISTE
jgi:hypothetical protein